MKVNIGCGISPTPEWLNFDNTVSISLSKHPHLVKLLYQLKIINTIQMNSIAFHQANPVVKRADASKHIPLPNESVEVLYSSHMFEHLDINQSSRFLNEVMRILQPGGIIRLAVPDMKLRLERYSVDNDADKLIESTSLAPPVLDNFKDRFLFFVNGNRGHKWMYDGRSLSLLLERNGFEDTVVLNAGETTINDYGKLNLFERETDSVYVEARKPKT